MVRASHAVPSRQRRLGRGVWAEQRSRQPPRASCLLSRGTVARVGRNSGVVGCWGLRAEQRFPPSPWVGICVPSRYRLLPSLRTCAWRRLPCPAHAAARGVFLEVQARGCSWEVGTRGRVCIVCCLSVRRTTSIPSARSLFGLKTAAVARGGRAPSVLLGLLA